MRTTEQFKTYVYEKADAKRKTVRKKRALVLRGVAAFSLCIVVTGVFLYSSDKGGLDAPAQKSEMEVLQAEVYGETLAMVLDSAEVSIEEADGTVDYGYLYRADKYDTVDDEAKLACVQYSSTAAGAMYTLAEDADSYNGELTDVDFTKYVALVFSACVKNHIVNYTDERITVSLICSEEAVTGNTAYTVLLDKQLYAGQPIYVNLQ